MWNKKISVYLLTVLTITSLVGCTSSKAATGSVEPAPSATTQIPSGNPTELSNLSAWKKISLEAPSYKFTIKAPPSAYYKFSPDNSLGTENGIFFGEDKWPKGLLIEYTAMVDRDARTITFKNEYTKSKPSDITFSGVEDAKLYQDKTAQGVPFSKYLLRKQGNLYIVTIQTDNESRANAYKEMVKTLEIQK